MVLLATDVYANERFFHVQQYAFGYYLVYYLETITASLSAFGYFSICSNTGHLHLNK